MRGSICPQRAYVIHNWLYQPANSRMYQTTKKQGIGNLMYFNFYSHQHYQQEKKMENNLLISYNAEKNAFP